MRVEFNFVFDRKKKIKKPLDKGLIELRAYHKAKTKYFSTKIEVMETEWNGQKQKIVRHGSADLLNDDLDHLYEKVTKTQRAAENNEQHFDLESVKTLLKYSGIKSDPVTDFVKFATAEVENNNGIKEVTKRSYKNTLRKIQTYTQNKPILFTDLNYTFFHDFINFLNGLSLGQNTVRKHNKNCKSLIEIAIKKGHYKKSNPCKEIKIKELETKINALTWEQMQTIEKLNFEQYETRLETIRDMFMFSCYTGLRISDLTTLKKEYLKESPGGLLLDLFTKKVNKHAVIPLYELFPIIEEKTTRPIKILKKYLKENTEHIFPKYSDQLYNRELKELGYRAKIDFNLTSHIGRKTFATYLPNTGTSTFTLKSLLQHSNLKTTEKYVKVDEKRVSNDLKKANWN